MCTVLLPPGVNSIAVKYIYNIYIYIVSYHIINLTGHHLCYQVVKLISQFKTFIHNIYTIVQYKKDAGFPDGIRNSAVYTSSQTLWRTLKLED
jgi:hypothetical protein